MKTFAFAISMDQSTHLLFSSFCWLERYFPWMLVSRSAAAAGPWYSYTSRDVWSALHRYTNYCDLLFFQYCKNKYTSFMNVPKNVEFLFCGWFLIRNDCGITLALTQSCKNSTLLSFRHNFLICDEIWLNFCLTCLSWRWREGWWFLEKREAEDTILVIKRQNGVSRFVYYSLSAESV